MAQLEADPADRSLDRAEPREVELKLELEPGSSEALLQHPLLCGRIGAAQQTSSVYYDTRKKALRDAGVTLRVRKAGGAFIQTVKANGAANAGLFDRAEWETSIEGPQPDFDRIATAIEPLSQPGVRKRLRPVYETTIDRRAIRLDHNGTQIELVLDQGEVVAGDQRQPLLELELELISGSPRALFDVARELQSHVALRLGVLTKSERGERLASGRSQRAAKAEPVRLSPTMTASEAFRAIAFSCLRHFCANEPLVIAARDTDALHQSRVALRRLRSALSLFKPILSRRHRARFNDELRVLAGTLGYARNIDVLLQRRTEQLSRASRERLMAERGNAYDAAIAALRSPQTATLMIDIAEWIALGKHDKAKAAGRPATRFADAVLDRFWKRVGRRGAALARIDDGQRHELRIAGKKLRYAAEFFSDLHAEPELAPRRDMFIAELECLQDGLGGLNDLVTEAELEAGLADLGIVLPRPSESEEAAHRKQLLRDSVQAFRNLAAAGPYWDASAHADSSPRIRRKQKQPAQAPLAD